MLREQAYAAFKRGLATGALTPGQFVSQRELVEITGLPLAPVRDAVRRLEAEGLVQVIPQRGISVASLDASLLRESFELRLALETFAIRRVAAEGDPSAVVEIGVELRGIAEAAGASFTDELAAAALDADRRLHTTIIASLGNHTLLETFRSGFDKMWYLRSNRRFTYERFVKATIEHLAIVEAVAGRDPDAAVAALEQHIDASMKAAFGLRS